MKRTISLQKNRFELKNYFSRRCAFGTQSNIKYCSVPLKGSIDKLTNLDKTNSRVLSIAALKGHYDILDDLSKNNPNFKWTEDIAFYAACRDMKMLKWVRERGCPWDNRVLDTLIQNENVDDLRWVLENDIPLSSESYTNASRYTTQEIVVALQEEATKRLCRLLEEGANIQECAELIRCGANPNACNSLGMSILHNMVIDDKTVGKFIQMINLGCNPMTKDTINDFTPLYYAIRYANLDIIKYYLTHNFRIEDHISMYQTNIFHTFAHETVKYTDQMSLIIQEIFDKCQIEDLELKDMDGNTPFDLAKNQYWKIELFNSWIHQTETKRRDELNKIYKTFSNDKEKTIMKIDFIVSNLERSRWISKENFIGHLQNISSLDRYHFILDEGNILNNIVDEIRKKNMNTYRLNKMFYDLYNGLESNKPFLKIGNRFLDELRVEFDQL
jgi:ankyrin repeat protein